MTMLHASKSYGYYIAAEYRDSLIIIWYTHVNIVQCQMYAYNCVFVYDDTEVDNVRDHGYYMLDCKLIKIYVNMIL